jgi:hypothetical protein
MFGVMRPASLLRLALGFRVALARLNTLGTARLTAGPLVILLELVEQLFALLSAVAIGSVGHSSLLKKCSREAQGTCQVNADATAHNVPDLTAARSAVRTARAARSTKREPFFPGATHG